MKRLLILAIVLAAGLTGCASSAEYAAENQSTEGTAPGDTAEEEESDGVVYSDSDYIYEMTKVLSDGREITCLVYYDGGGMSCDWNPVGVND